MPDLPATAASKPAWRAWAKETRAALSPAERALRSAALVERLATWPPFRDATHALIYLAFGDELSLDGLFEPSDAARASPRADRPRLHAPRIESDDRLAVHALEPTRLERHRLGMRQPRADAPRTPLEAIDVVVVPGLAFDRHGTRLGFGLGYYDRFLARLPAGVPRVGVCADALLVDALPRDPHDVAMTHVATPSQLVPAALDAAP